MKIHQLSHKKINDFRSVIWDYYSQYSRSFPWRSIHDPYNIVVSEIMLQQTQTNRVITKYQNFITQLPTFQALASAPFQFVLELWQGLGYNRRALYLHHIAKKIINEYNNALPKNPATLKQFPGLGDATASSICAFAYNMPVVFIETNIRTVFIHHFFCNAKTVYDKEIMPLIKITLEKNQAREWYYALMDYGVMLKKEHKNPNRKSAHHIKQSQFEGSHRQIRGNILKLLLTEKSLPIEEIIHNLKKEPDRIHAALLELEQDKLIQKNNHRYIISP